MSLWFLRVSRRAEAQPSSPHQPCLREEQFLVFLHPASDSQASGWGSLQGFGTDLLLFKQAVLMWC